MMEWLVNDWSFLVALLCICVGIYMTIRKYAGSPTEDQVRAIKAWLVYAVIQAEKDLGGGTGRLKLRQVYDAFVSRFPWAARVVSFDIFALWVDEALIEMRKLLETNDNVKAYVEGDE